MNLLLSLNTVLPILIYMLLGAFLNRIKCLSAQTRGEMNKIIFAWLFPLVMFSNIYRTDLEQVLNVPFLLTLLALVAVVVTASIVLIPRYFSDKRQQGSMIQAIIRGNTLLFALPMVSSISGPENMGLATLCVGLLAPLFNIICVVVLEVLRGAKMQLWPLMRSVARNPLVLGALAGVLFKVFDIRLPQVLFGVVGSLVGMVTPLALIMLGGSLRFADAVGYRRQITVVSVAKLLLVPLLFVLTVKLMGFGKLETTTALALSAVPPAVSTFVMAGELGADSVLAGQIVATTSALSVMTVFVWVLALSGLGWLG